MVIGAAVDTVTIAFPVRPTSCLSSILYGPLEGWVKQVLPAVLTTDSSFLPLAVTVSPGFHATKKISERGDHNGLTAHLTKPSLINTHCSCCKVNLQRVRGIWMVDCEACPLKYDGCRWKMQLNTQRFYLRITCWPKNQEALTSSIKCFIWARVDNDMNIQIHSLKSKGRKQRIRLPNKNIYTLAQNRLFN